MRARRSIAAPMLTAAAVSATVGGFAITGSLDTASAASPVRPPLSLPQGGNGQGQNQCGNQGGNGQSQSTAKCKPRLTLADLAGGISGTLNGSSLSASNLHGNAAGAAGTEMLQTGTLNIEGFSNSDCPDNALIDLCLDVSGTFTITTRVGTLSGTASGGVGEDLSSGPSGPQIAPVAGELALAVTSGTGRFASTAGTLDVAFQFPTFSSNFVGTITVP
jgi:hypothetical protein